MPLQVIPSGNNWFNCSAFNVYRYLRQLSLMIKAKQKHERYINTYKFKYVTLYAIRDNNSTKSLKVFLEEFHCSLVL